MAYRNGFTLIELILVIVLIGIVAVFAAPRLGNITVTNAGAFTDKLRADTRYAQNLAMTGNTRTRVVFTTTSYEVRSSATATCSSFNTAMDPATGSPLQVTLNTGTYAGITLSGTACLEYDSLGRPYDCASAPAPGLCATSLSGMVITVIANGATTVGTVTVTAQTGAVN